MGLPTWTFLLPVSEGLIWFRAASILRRMRIQSRLRKRVCSRKIWSTSCATSFSGRVTRYHPPMSARLFTGSQIASLGGGASQFSINAGDPRLSLSQFDVGAFVGDDWKINQKLTMSLGFRYEAQTNIRDRHDLAPRLSIAWGLAPKTVIR